MPYTPPQGGSAAIVGVLPKSANYTAVLADKGYIINMTAGASNRTVTFDAATLVAGWYCWLRKADNDVGIVLTSPVTSPAATGLFGYQDMALIWSDGTNYFAEVNGWTETAAGVLTRTVPNGNSAILDFFGGTAGACQARAEFSNGTNAFVLGTRTADIFSLASGSIERIKISALGRTSKQCGTSTAFGGVSSSPYSNVTAVGNITTGEDDLITQSIAANIMVSSGERLRITAAFTFGATVNVKTLKFYFGATTVTIATALALNTGTLLVEAMITRTGSGTQNVQISAVGSNSLLLTFAAFTTAAESMAGAITTKFTAEAVDTNDIIQKDLLIEHLPIV